MNTRINVGKGITGAVRYCRGEGRDPISGAILPTADIGQGRVAWYGGTGFSFEIASEAHLDLARKIMEFDALNQASRTKKCEQDAVHLTLSWAVGQTPTRQEMEDAAKSALADLGMGNAKALFFAHDDEDYAHIHIVASKINPATGRAYDLKGSWRTLSTWAEHYERDHGGVISLRRQDANELRTAIKARDPLAVLEAMTKQRSTFTANQLDRALQKEIQAPRGANAEEVKSVALQRAQFANAILDHAQTIHLTDTPDGPTARYTTRAVFEAELYVLRAADGLVNNTTHGLNDQQRAATLNQTRYDGITREQARAFRHVTGDAGLAIIDGQAGTGKSFTIAAIRLAYESDGRRVIGLAPTNTVAEDMKNDGFGHAATIHSELFALNSGRTRWDAATVVIVDEAAMLDTKLMAMVTAHAYDVGAKLILAGDDRQLSSIDRGGMFGKLKDRHGAAELAEVKRQHKNDERRASEMMAEGNFHDALNIYDNKGDIHWTRTQPEARAQLVEQWSKDSAAEPDKTRFVFAYTNDAVKQLNTALRAVRKERGELEWEDHEIKTAHGKFQFSTGDRIQFTATDKQAGILNAAAGTIEAIDGTHIAVRLDGRRPKTINFDAATFDQFRHGYAGTIYKAQGRTLDQTYLYHTDHWRNAASYVALTRHRDKTTLFVARNTAANVKELARQMGRVDDRRAATMFYHRQQVGPLRPINPSEILAQLGGLSIGQKTERKPTSPRLDLNPPPPARQQKPPTNPFKKLADALPVIDAAEYLARLKAGLANADPATLQKVAFLNARRAHTANPSAPRRQRPRTLNPMPRPPWPAFRERRSSYYAAANQNVARRITLKAIRDPWNAVDHALPRNPDRTLLSAVATCAEHCAKIAFAYGRAAIIVEPDQVDFYRARYDTALLREDEARTRLAALPPDHKAAVSPFLHPELIQQNAEARLLSDRAALLLARDPQIDARTIDHEALEQDRWNVLWRPLAGDADRALANQILHTAHDLFDEVKQYREAAYTPEERRVWDQYAALLEYGRFRDAGVRLTELDRLDAPVRPQPLSPEQRAAERYAHLLETSPVTMAPETMTLDGIAKHPWDAVHLVLPQPASLDLLIACRAAAAQCAVDARSEIACLDPQDPDRDGEARDLQWEEQQAKQRVDEVDRRLQPQTKPDLSLEAFAHHRDHITTLMDHIGAALALDQSYAGAMTAEKIHNDPWNAVVLDLPANPEPQLLAFVAATAELFHHGFADRAQIAETHGELADAEKLYERSELSKTRQQEAELRLVALETGMPLPDRLQTAPTITADKILDAEALAERVQRIIDDPFCEADERDERVLLALALRREQEPTLYPNYTDDQRAYYAETSQEAAPVSAAAQDAAAVDQALTSQEMTDDKQAEYSRSTSEMFGAAGSEVADPAPSVGGGRGLSRTR